MLKFSLEMEGMQLFEREVSRNGNVSSTCLKDPINNNLDFAAMTKGASIAAQSNIYIDDTSKLDMYSLKRKARRFKAKHPELALIIVDYLTLMELPKGERHIAVTETSRQMKLLAKELKTPVLLLSQLNKEVGKQKREPTIQDLRDGAIEQDADKIIFPFRDGAFDPNSPNKNLAKVLKRKVRDGEIGDVLFKWENGNFYKADNLTWVETETNGRNGGGFEA